MITSTNSLKRQSRIHGLFHTIESLYSQAFQILPLIILITNVEAVHSTLLKLKFNLSEDLAILISEFDEVVIGAIS